MISTLIRRNARRNFLRLMATFHAISFNEKGNFTSTPFFVTKFLIRFYAIFHHPSHTHTHSGETWHISHFVPFYCISLFESKRWGVMDGIYISENLVTFVLMMEQIEIFLFHLQQFFFNEKILLASDPFKLVFFFTKCIQKFTNG